MLLRIGSSTVSVLQSAPQVMVIGLFTIIAIAIIYFIIDYLDKD